MSEVIDRVVPSSAYHISPSHVLKVKNAPCLSFILVTQDEGFNVFYIVQLNADTKVGEGGGITTFSFKASEDGGGVRLIDATCDEEGYYIVFSDDRRRHTLLVITSDLSNAKTYSFPKAWRVTACAPKGDKLYLNALNADESFIHCCDKRELFNRITEHNDVVEIVYEPCIGHKYPNDVEQQAFAFSDNATSPYLAATLLKQYGTGRWEVGVYTDSTHHSVTVDAPDPKHYRCHYERVVFTGSTLCAIGIAKSLTEDNVTSFILNEIDPSTKHQTRRMINTLDVKHISDVLYTRDTLHVIAPRPKNPMHHYYWRHHFSDHTDRIELYEPAIDTLCAYLYEEGDAVYIAGLDAAQNGISLAVGKVYSFSKGS